jgi:hypothetical protein
MATKKISPEPCLFCGEASRATSREYFPCGARTAGECPGPNLTPEGRAVPNQPDDDKESQSWPKS